MSGWLITTQLSHTVNSDLVGAPVSPPKTFAIGEHWETWFMRAALQARAAGMHMALIFVKRVEEDGLIEAMEGC